jgi:hypothetical protein
MQLFTAAAHVCRGSELRMGDRQLSMPGALLLRDSSLLDTPNGRRLLLIAPGFPPSAAVGGLRWQKMLHVLEEYGWRADVLTVMPPDEASTDRSRLDNVPRGTRVFALPARAFEDRALVRAMSAVRLLRRLGRPRTATSLEPSGGGLVSVPSAAAPSSHRVALRLQIAKRARRIASRAMAEACRFVGADSYSVIISSGPPHSAHLAAMKVAGRSGIPWVMDWRDPWTFDEFLEGFDAEAFARGERPSERACVDGGTGDRGEYTTRRSQTGIAVSPRRSAHCGDSQRRR